MRDSMSFDTVPFEEDGQQLGPNYDPIKARKEAEVTIAQIVRQHGKPPAGGFFKIRSNPHDFGDYLSITFIYDDECEDAVKYAYDVEGNWPALYDAESRKALGLDLSTKR